MCRCIMQFELSVDRVSDDISLCKRNIFYRDLFIYYVKEPKHGGGQFKNKLIYEIDKYT